MQRRALGALVVVVGVAFLVVVFGNGLFGASSAWEDLSDDVRPSYTDEGIAALRADAERLRALTGELGSTVLPTIAQALNLTEAEVTSQFLSSFPATAQAALAMPQIANALEDRADLLEAQQPNFRSADAIPTADGATTGVPWFITITGILAIVGGVAMTRRLGRTIPTLVAVLGLVMVLVPLFTSLPEKAADADGLNEATAPIFAAESITASEEAVATLRAMSSELEEGLIPGLAQQLGVTQPEAAAFVQANFPEITAALASAPETITRLEQTTDLIATNTDEYAEVREVPNQTVAWSVIAGGIATIVLASIAVSSNERAEAGVRARRERRAERAA